MVIGPCPIDRLKIEEGIGLWISTARVTWWDTAEINVVIEI